jgi:hypothetical protein
LGEVSPIGQLFSLGNSSNYRRGPNFWDTIFHGKSFVSNLTKNGLGYTLGDFFSQKTSGRPASNQQMAL